MLIQALVFLACFYFNDCNDNSMFAGYGELVTVELRGYGIGTAGKRDSKILIVNSDRDWASIFVVSDMHKAGSDRKVRDVVIQRRNQFIEKMHFECAKTENGTRFACGENIYDAYFHSADDNKYTKLKKNYWAKDSDACSNVGGWCIRCNASHCPPYYHSMDCSDDALGSKCRAFTFGGFAKYKCKSIPALMNPGCNVTGCVGNNRKTSAIRLYKQPECEIFDVFFKMEMKLFEQQVVEDHNIINITFSGNGDEPIFRIQLEIRQCEPSVGCRVHLASQALSRSGKYHPRDDGNWELAGDFYYKPIETVNNGHREVARMNYIDAVNTCWDHGGDLPVLNGTRHATPYVAGIEFYKYCKQHNYDCWLGLAWFARRGTWIWRRDYEELKTDNFPHQHLSLDARLAGVIVDFENTESPEGLKMKSVSNESLHAVVCQRNKTATDLDFDDNCPLAVKPYRSWIHNEVHTESCRQALLTYFGQRLIHSFLHETDAGAQGIDIQRFRSVSCNDTAKIMWRRNYEVVKGAPECQPEIQRWMARNTRMRHKRKFDDTAADEALIKEANGSSSYIEDTVFSATKEAR